MIKSFLLFSLVILTGVFSFEQVQIEKEDSLIQKIKQNAYYCVRCFEEDKIFINPQNILLSGQGLFLDLNGREYCSLPFLQSNSNGCYLQINPAIISCQRKTLGLCPWCGEKTNSIGECTNLECELYKVKVRP